LLNVQIENGFSKDTVKRKKRQIGLGENICKADINKVKTCASEDSKFFVSK
jgi:hypothetical protein